MVWEQNVIAHLMGDNEVDLWLAGWLAGWMMRDVGVFMSDPRTKTNNETEAGM